MAQRNTRSQDKEPGNGSNNSDERFNQLLEAFMQSQTTQNEQQRAAEAERAAERAQADRDRAAFQAQILALTDRAAQPVQVVIPPREVDPNDLYEKFRKMVPPEFHGSEDPMAADDFIEQLEQIFIIFYYT